MAVAHSMVVLLYHIIRRRQPCYDLGHRCFEERDRAAITRRGVRQLERLGHQVNLVAA